MTKRILGLSLLLMLTVAVVAIPGCDGEETTTAATGSAATQATAASAVPTQQELQQIINDSMLSMVKLNTYKFDGNMDMVMKITGGDEAGDMNMVYQMTGAYNIAEQEMQMTMDISMESETMPADMDMQDISAEMYMLADSMYMKMDMPGMGTQWVKMPFSEEMKELYNLDMVNQQMAMLESVTDIKFLRYESYDGSECYVLEMVPDMAAMMSWLGDQMPADLPIEDLDVVSEMFKDLNYTIWVTKDDRILKKMDVSIFMDVDATDFGGDEDDGRVTMDMSMTIKIYDHNQPVSITLPAEAENAMQMPGM